MQHDDNDDHAGAPVVQTAHESAGRDFGEDVTEAVVGFARRRRVIERQHDAGEKLDQNQKQRDAAEDLMPAARGWDFLIEEFRRPVCRPVRWSNSSMNSVESFLHGGLQPFASVGGLQRAQLQAVVLDLRCVAVERPRRGAGEHLTVEREERCMAGAGELFHAFVPVIGAAEMRALGAERDDLVVRLLHHPGGLFFRDHAPAIDAALLKAHFDRSAGRELADVARVDPAGCFAGSGRHQR